MRWSAKFAQRVGNRGRDSESSFSPRQFNDEVAEKTSWEPLVRGGASFRTHKIVSSDAHRLEIKPTLGSILFCLLFVLIGAGMMIGFGVHLGMNWGDFEKESLLILVVGTIFFCAGLALLKTSLKPATFDRRTGVFRKGAAKTDGRSPNETDKNTTPLNRVHAIQIVSEYCRGDKSSYTSYEINLVLGDGERVNVVDHGSLASIRSDAETISKFLGRPLWSSLR